MVESEIYPKGPAMDQTKTGVRCGNHARSERVYHASVADVSACYVQDRTNAEAAEVDYKIEQAQERWYEERGAQPEDPRERDMWGWAADLEVQTEPEPARQAQPARRLASPAQVKFLRSLLADRDIPGHHNAFVVGLEAELGNADTGGSEPLRLSSFDAHKAIDRLKGFGKRTMYTDSRQAKVNSTVQTDGMYRNPDSGEIFKVQFNKATGSGRALYAKALVIETDPVYKIEGVPASGIAEPAVVTFVYRPGLISKIRPEWLMDLEEAKSFGALYGTCVYGHPLTDEKSIAEGIGPICKMKFGMPK